MFINRSLWKGYEVAECDENSTETESSGKSVINICTWNIDVLDVLQEHIEHFSDLGTVCVIGDINGRVGIESDSILDDILDENLQDILNLTPGRVQDREISNTRG